MGRARKTERERIGEREHRVKEDKRDGRRMSQKRGEI